MSVRVITFSIHMQVRAYVRGYASRRVSVCDLCLVTCVHNMTICLSTSMCMCVRACECARIYVYPRVCVCVCARAHACVLCHMSVLIITGMCGVDTEGARAYLSYV